MSVRLTSTLQSVCKTFNVAQGATARATVAAMLNDEALFKLPDLSYDYGALEPTIIGEIMELHHSKHHQTYINNLKPALENWLKAEEAGDSAAAAAAESAICFNGGGHVNHAIFWQNLAPQGSGGGEEPTGALAEAINAEFGSFQALKDKFNASTAPVQGSGWGWLGYDKGAGKLAIVTRPNQDVPETAGVEPLLGVDVWEHAYYLQYKNLRPDYLKAVWEVVNFKDVEARFEAARK